MFAMTSCGKKEQKMCFLSLRDASLFLIFRKGSVQQYVPDVMSQYDRTSLILSSTSCGCLHRSATTQKLHRAAI
jgi:hypothetical protein